MKYHVKINARDYKYRFQDIYPLYTSVFCGYSQARFFGPIESKAKQLGGLTVGHHEYGAWYNPYNCIEIGVAPGIGVLLYGGSDMGASPTQLENW